MSPINERGKEEFEKVVAETSKLLDILAQTKRTLGWKVEVMTETRDQNNKSLWEVSQVPEETQALVGVGVLGS